MPDDLERNAGFVLIAVLLSMSLLCLVGGLLQLELALVGTLVAESETQMHSQVLAANGLELARAMLPAVETPELLLGSNGVPDCLGVPGWRDPVPLESAWQTDPMLLTSDCDDGLPSFLGLTPSAPAMPTTDGGWILLRFSNDPGEPPGEDHNGTVVVRSMGIVPARLRQTARFSGRNNVTMVEAHLRRERGFAAETALTLVGEGARIRLPAADSIQREGGPPLEIIEYPEAGLVDDIEQTARDLGLAVDNWYRNVSEARLSDPSLLRLLEPGFWMDLNARLESLGGGRGSSDSGRGLHVLPQGAVLEGEREGLFLACGDVVLSSGTSLRGLLVHLGGGRVRIESGASLCGALWMTGFTAGEAGLESRDIDLEIRPGGQLIYDEKNVRGAMAYLPPTQLMWRIIFPEMAE